MAYTVIRTDLLSGTKQPADLLSVRVYDAEGNMIDAENGVIVKIGALEEGEREVYKATLATANDPLYECAILAGVELMYDERKKSLDEYINEAGKAVRAYIPRTRNMWSITKEGFVNEEVPEVGGAVAIGEGGKLVAAESDGIGTCIAIEQAGKYVMYVIRNMNTEVAPASGGDGGNG